MEALRNEFFETWEKEIAAYQETAKMNFQIKQKSFLKFLQIR